MAKIMKRDGDEAVRKHVNEAERLAGETAKAEEVEAARGRANALRDADATAGRIKANARTGGATQPNRKGDAR